MMMTTMMMLRLRMVFATRADNDALKDESFNTDDRDDDADG